MIIKGKDPDTGSNEGITSTTVDDRHALDIKDISLTFDEDGNLKVVVEGLTVEADTINLDTSDLEALLAHLTDGNQKAKIVDEAGNPIGGDTPVNVSISSQDISTLATQATLAEIKTLLEESGIAVSIEDRVYSPNTALMSAVVVNSATAVLSTAWLCAVYAQKSLRIQAAKTGTWDNGVTVEVQGAEDDVEANYAPIYEIGTNGVITISDAINRIYSIPYHVNYIRLKVTNLNTTPASNYPTMTVKAMGQM